MKKLFNIALVCFAFMSSALLAGEERLDPKSAKDLSAVKVKSAKQSESKEALANPYIIGVINTSDYTIRAMSIDGGAHYTPTPLIGKNCTTTYDDCFQKQMYNEVATVSCGSVVRLAFKAYKGNTILTVDYDQFTAECSYKGGIVLLENPH